ncbi:MAG: NYN domain-containing protein [Methanoregulaceae archaeon]
MEGCPPLEFPIQQFSYTARKNATDSALRIDAIDLLRCGEPGRLLPGLKRQRLHPPRLTDPESGLIVYWFREEKTPKAFVDACDKFIYTEILRSADSAGAATPCFPGRFSFQGCKKATRSS